MMIRIGTSGWNYPAWKDDFYQGVPRRKWLAHISERFPAVEINATYYRSPKPETQEKWLTETADDFVFAAKGHRIITHSKRLKNAGESLRLQYENLKPLSPKLRVMLWQLPKSAKCDIDRLHAFLDDLQTWPEVKHVMEFRDTSWFTDAVARALESAGVGNVVSDAADWPMWEAVTGDIAYVRLHGHSRTYASDYARATLEAWAGTIRKWADADADVYVFFDNDSEGHAPHNATELIKILGLVREPA